MIYSNENIDEASMSADEVIQWIYDEFKKQYKEYDFQISSIVFKDFDEYAQKLYQIRIDYTKAIKVEDLLLTIGTGLCEGMDEIGKCLAIIPFPKDREVECFTEIYKSFNAENYALIFSCKGKICTPKLRIPKPLDVAMEIAIQPMEVAIKRYDIYDEMSLYPSSILKYDEDFLQKLFFAFEYKLGLKNEKTRNIELQLESYKGKSEIDLMTCIRLQRDIENIRDQVSLRLELHGENGYAQVYKKLYESIRKLKEIGYS